MTFDWFRRRYDEEQPEEPKAAETEATQPAPASEKSASDQAEDYLNYAKLAYENIRKRQQESAQAAEAPIVATPDTAEPDSGAETPEPSSEETSPVEETVVEAPIAAEPIAAPEPLTEPSAISESATPAETPTESAAPLPFWAAAEAERLARLEQLRETAIVEPEPEPVKPAEPAVTATVPDVPDFILDEGFVWSTEILAAQGRRPDQISIEEITWLKRLRQGLDKTRRGLVNQLRAIVGQGPLNQDAVMEIEAALLQSDVGVEATDAIIEALQNKLRAETLPPDAAITYLKQIIREMLDRPLGEYGNLAFAPEKDTLNIWLMTGVNGAGKTTTIGKLAHIAQKSGYNCLIAAADTFRAAAVEQVKVWGARSGVEVIANPGKNTDPAAVVFDGITAAQSRGTDLLLIDTAGRLQNKKNLMDELSKVRRIIDKKAPDAKVESLLVLDSTLGQNGLRQAQVFSESAKLSGVVLTKLDGTAKGGIALAVVQQLGLPIRFIGAGEGIEDLRPFSSYEFVEALLNG
ncbi:MAG: signal recognition particle-docking protein FtsY [Leptolyngbyaceae cyanobacterium bins.302]|nr:signal recognition particle-docking protein FtsY [Leptolyngbyaceae cyanobacterium bins.302]